MSLPPPKNSASSSSPTLPSAAVRPFPLPPPSLLTELDAGFLTGRYKTPEDFKNDADFRSMLPRMQKEVFAHNYKIVTAFEEIAARKGCTSGQLALAWLLAQGDNIIPIPGVSPSPLPRFLPPSLPLRARPRTRIKRPADVH